MFHLPDGFTDLMPEKAEVFYFVKNRLMGIFRQYGYGVVSPSSVEFLDTFLLSGEKEEHTFNFIDFYAGKTACFRYDFTPQIARMVAARGDAAGRMPCRLCYEGPVLRNPEGMTGSMREICHAGVELVGVPGEEAEAELVLLAHRCFEQLGCSSTKFFLNDMNIVRSVLNGVDITGECLAELHAALIVRDMSSVRSITAKLKLGKELTGFINELGFLCGDEKLIGMVRKKFGTLKIAHWLDRLERLHRLVLPYTGDRLFFDLGELRGFNYHTGVVFDIYAGDLSGKSVEVITGGRYDNLLEKFGCVSLPAVGFAVDVMKLCGCIRHEHAPHILICSLREKGRVAAVLRLAEALRNGGYRVSTELAARNSGGIPSRSKEKRFDYVVQLMDNKQVLVSPGAETVPGAACADKTEMNIQRIVKETV